MERRKNILVFIKSKIEEWSLKIWKLVDFELTTFALHSEQFKNCSQLFNTIIILITMNMDNPTLYVFKQDKSER